MRSAAGNKGIGVFFVFRCLKFQSPPFQSSDSVITAHRLHVDMALTTYLTKILGLVRCNLRTDNISGLRVSLVSLSC